MTYYSSGRNRGLEGLVIGWILGFVLGMVTMYTYIVILPEKTVSAVSVSQVSQVLSQQQTGEVK